MPHHVLPSNLESEPEPVFFLAFFQLVNRKLNNYLVSQCVFLCGSMKYKRAFKFARHFSVNSKVNALFILDDIALIMKQRNILQELTS